MNYPVDVQFEYGDGQRSRAFAVAGIILPIKLLMALPHIVVLYLLQIGAFVASWFGFWAIAFTGSLPAGIARFVHNSLGWQMRASAWIASMSDEYPGFAVEQSSYPANVVITEPTLERGRGLAVAGIIWFLKAILLIPHIIVLNFVGFAAAIAGWIAYWAIAFTGVYPEGIFRFVAGTLRWSTRTSAWLFSLTDEYPPFALNE
jgi:hypothetical protein